MRKLRYELSCNFQITKYEFISLVHWIDYFINKYYNFIIISFFLHIYFFLNILLIHCKKNNRYKFIYFLPAKQPTLVVRRSHLYYCGIFFCNVRSNVVMEQTYLSVRPCSGVGPMCFFFNARLNFINFCIGSD